MESQEPTCPICNAPIPPKGKTGPRKSYCSSECRREANRPNAVIASKKATADRVEQNRKKRAATVKVCPVCGDEFSPAKSMRQMYCSKLCLRKATRDSKSKQCSEPGCDRPVRARGVCTMHYRRDARADGREKSDPWSPRRREAYHRRLAKKFGPGYERFNRLEVFERDEWICAICHEPVDPALSYPDPMSASLDHRIPLAKGGKHTYNNSQCTHLFCNESKGARLIAELRQGDHAGATPA